MGRHRNAEKSLQDQTNILPIGQLIIVFSGLAFSLLICFIDQNGISVALPTISKELNAEQTISWAGTSALIANTVCTVLYGRLSDIFGRKSVYLSVLILLSIADLLCGLSQNASMLYVFRALAGIATGGITNMTMIIVSDVVTLQDRGKYQGILGSCVGLGNVIGPFISAAFVQRASWRDIFYLLCPWAAVCAIIAWFLLPSKMRPESRKSQVKKIDFWGVLTSTIAIIFVLIPVSGGGLYFQWNSPMVISMLIIGGCSFVAFLFIEWKVAALPMMPLSLFKSPVITALFAQSFLLGAAYQSLLYYLPLYIQNGRGWSPIQSALLTMPMVLPQSMASISSGLYMSRRNRYLEVICTGFALWLLGSGLTLMFDDSTSKGVICGVLVVVGGGIGCTFQPTLVAMQAHTTMAKRAVVISVRNFFRCGGGAVGLAVSAAILQAVLKRNLPAGYEYLAHSTYATPDRSSVPAADWDAIVNAYVKASHAVFIFQVPLVGLCLLCCVFIRDKGLNKPEEKNTQKETPKAATESTATTQVDVEMEAVEGEDNFGHNVPGQSDEKEKDAMCLVTSPALEVTAEKTRS
ncbi:putative MFS transporter [Talaromyces proteolyticus]|uniref:MFS transporter n=1 Tax=Talaromyces proteolyticus TaxID=1131652 RepID=A0AAD4KMB5_9EURO|nr:putative MFS transporter [Talaromyces proteolyticus]KAH8695983.1 putative MFS transporter [Talaromyces proteolyticus]